MDTGLEMLKRRLSPIFVRDIEDGVRGGRLISLAGLHGNGGGVRLKGISAADGQGQGGMKAGRRGSGALLEWLAEAYEEAEGSRTDPQQWLLAESADGALDLLLRGLVPGGGTVLVETPAAPEALELMRRRGIRAVPVACDRDGMLPDDLRRKCEPSGGRPVIIYVTPHYANPSGRVWSRQRKLALLEISERLGVPIVEDDTACLVPLAEGALASGGVQQMDTTSLYALRQQAGMWGAEIVSLGSLERTLTPQLPLAWLRGEAKTMERLRRVPSPGSSSAAGAAVAERARRLHAGLAQPPGRGRAAAAEAAAAYAARRALALELLQAPAWRGACVEDPGGGLFLWLRLPAGVSSEALLRASLLEGTAFLPGTLCYAKEPDDRFIRLTVAAHEPARLREGLARLTAALAEFTVRSVD